MNKQAIEQAISQVCANIEGILLSKLSQYGDSLFNPTRVFSTADAIETINARIDDKLSRISSGDRSEDAEMDLIGYLIAKRAFMHLTYTKDKTEAAGVVTATATLTANPSADTALSGDRPALVNISKAQAIDAINRELTSICHELASTMVTKNTAYAGSAFMEQGLFCKLPVLEKIRVRLDDKVSRLMNASRSVKTSFSDTHFDLLGYLIVYMTASRLKQKESLRGISEALLRG